MNHLLKRTLALAALIAIASCSGTAPGSTVVPQGGAPAAQARGRNPHVSALLQNFVGVGDSLTAGYQAGGFLGDPQAKNPLLPGKRMYPGQEVGWWADVDEQMSGLPLSVAIALKAK